MSILTVRQWQQFSAPVYIGEKSAVSGSWARCTKVSPYEQAMAPNILFHLRLSTWKQECPTEVTDACLDWCVHADNGHMKHTVRVKVAMVNRDFSDVLNTSAFNLLIEEKLNHSPVVHKLAKALLSLQQAHPGDTRGVESGNAGNVGDNQSDW